MKYDARVDEAAYVLYAAIAEVAKEFRIQWMVTGAASRILLLESVYGLPRGKATEDVDFAVMVESWDQYRIIGDRICQNSQISRDAKQYQRFHHVNGAYFDLIPFGGVESEDHVIQWPRNNDVVMSVLGFREACGDSVRVTLNGTLDVPIISPVGLVLLKLIAWGERHLTHPRRDAADIAYVLRHFSAIETEQKLFQDHLDAIEAVEYDQDLASARVLGRRVGSLATDGTQVRLNELLNSEIGMGTDSLLIREIADSMPGKDAEQVCRLMEQLHTGLLDGVRS